MPPADKQHVTVTAVLAVVSSQCGDSHSNLHRSSAEKRKEGVSNWIKHSVQLGRTWQGAREYSTLASQAVPGRLSMAMASWRWGGLSHCACTCC